MIKKGALIIMLFLLTIRIVAAADYTTEIIVNGEEGWNVEIDVLDFDEDKKIGGFNTTMSDSTKILRFPSSRRTLSFDVRVVKDSVLLYSGKFGSYISGDAVSIDLLSEMNNAEEEPEETIAEEESSTEEIMEEEGEKGVGESGGVTGLLTSVIGEGGSNIIYFVIGVVILAGGVLFFTVGRKMIKRKASSKPIIVKKLSDLKKEQEDKEEREEKKEVKDVGGIEKRDKLIEELEKKIETARKELDYIKNEEKIKAAEKKLASDREELEKLRGSI